tara:strand:+ start:236 stop:487 length:252 start_codon:yes stop_codon:yes gene_type:complete
MVSEFVDRFTDYWTKLILYYIFIMTKKDLDKFINKIYQLNKILLLIEKSTEKKEELSKCSNHEEVIKLTKSWGFEIGKRWGES